MLKIKTKKPANWISWVFGILFILPLVYVAFCWWVGLNYGRKQIVTKVYKVWMGTEIHNTMERGVADWYLTYDLEGWKKADMARKMRAAKPGPFQRIEDYVYEQREIVFHYPYFETVVLPNKKSAFGDGDYKERKYEVVRKAWGGEGYRYAAGYNPKKPEQYYTSDISEIEEVILKGKDREDIANWKRYDWLRKFEENFGWMIEADGWMGELNILGIPAMVCVIASLALKDLRIWFYCLYCIIAYSFGRIGYFSPNLAFSKEGWLAIFYNLFDWLLPGRGHDLPYFLDYAILISIWVIIEISFTNLIKLIKHFLQRKKGEIANIY